MNIEIVKPTTMEKEQINQMVRIIDRCNREDGTEYVFDPSDDFNGENDINHFILFRDNEPVSTVYIFSHSLKEAELFCFTLPEYRRQGLMNILMEQVIEEVKRRSIASLLYVCDDRSDAGKSFAAQRKALYEFSEYSMLWTGNNRNEFKGTVELHKVKEEDRERLVEINSEAFSEDRAEAEQMIDQFISSDLRDFYSIQLDGEIIGMIGRYFEESRDYIHGFCIAEHYRGRGLGREALSSMIRICRRESPGREIVLEVETENANALGLYESCGFEIRSVFKYYRGE